MRESNILLAIFLGLEFEEGQDRLSIQGLGTQLIEDTFNKKWDWLMQVVEKIETLETKDGRTFTIDFYCNSVTIFEYGELNDELIFTEGEGRLENLYNACVEFVEWWNKNN